MTPHTLRHAAINAALNAALNAGAHLRDVQDFARHADPKTTMRYDRNRHSLDRHATYAIAQYTAGSEEKIRAFCCSLTEAVRPTVFTEPSTFAYTDLMATTKMLRVSERTHEGFKREAERRGETIDRVASDALRALRQREMGRQLAADLREDEQSWLDADLG